MAILLLLITIAHSQIPDCPNLQNTDGLASPDGFTCNCISGSYIWDETSNACVVDCTIGFNTDGTHVDNSTCGCNPGYFWDSVQLTCNADCSAAANPYAQSSIPNADGSCTCKPGSNWVWQTGTCDLDCKSINNTDQTDPQSNQCQCLNSAYVWVASNLTCTLNCNLAGNSTGVKID